MTLDEFNALSDEDKTSFLGLHDKMVDDLKNVEAERDSFKTENDTLKALNEKSEADLKSAKELNFTLARKMDSAAPKKTSEELIHEMFMKGD